MDLEPKDVVTPEVTEVEEDRPSLLDLTQIIRRQDLRDLGTSFTTALGPLASVLEKLQDINGQLRVSAKEAYRFNRFQVVVLILNLGLFSALVYSAYVAMQLGSSIQVQAKLITSLEGRVKERDFQIQHLLAKCSSEDPKP